MKTSFTALLGAASLAFATTVQAQDETPNTDFDKIEACFNDMQVQSVAATEAPVRTLDVYASGKSDSTRCSFALHGGQNILTNEESTAHEGSVNVGKNSYTFNMTDKSNGYDTEVVYNGVKFKTTAIPGSDDDRIEISGPVAEFAESMEMLKEEEAQGKAVITTSGDSITIVVAKGAVSDWVPEDIQNNTLMAMAGSVLALSRFDQEAITEAAKKSAAQKSSIIVMQPKF